MLRATTWSEEEEEEEEEEEGTEVGRAGRAGRPAFRDDALWAVDMHFWLHWCVRA